MSTPTTSPEDATPEFLKLLSEHERRLSNYVLGLVGCPHDTKDILQDGKMVMWQNFVSFEPGTNFPAWARTVLFHRILAYRRRSKKHAHDILDEETLRLLDAEDPAESVARERRWTEREKTLGDCIAKLTADQREILESRYEDGASIGTIAGRAGRTEGAVYRQLSRLRVALHRCVETTLAQATTNHE